MSSSDSEPKVSQPSVPNPATPERPNTGSPMDDEAEPGTDPLHEGP